MATTNPPTEAARLRDLILEDPASVVGDAAVLSALIDATEGAAGANVIDLRGALLEQCAQGVGLALCAAGAAHQRQHLTDGAGHMLLGPLRVERRRRRG
ncbi:MAG: hypothetical protein AAFW69_10305, partial [Pseudomonadota bacterium]